MGSSFGVPLPYGCIEENSHIRLTVKKTGRIVDTEINSLRTWQPSNYGYPLDSNGTPIDNPDKYVRWLQIHASIPIEDGEAPELLLEFDAPPTLTGSGSFYYLNVDDHYVINPGSQGNGYRFNRLRPFGEFELTIDGYTSVCTDHTISEDNTRSSTVHLSYLSVGIYKDITGEPIAECRIRVKVYKDSPIARVYHTLTWNGRIDPQARTNSNSDFVADYVEYEFDSLIFKAEQNVLTDAHIKIFDPSTQGSRNLLNAELYRQTSYGLVEESTGTTAGKLATSVVTSTRGIDGPSNRSYAIRWSEENYPISYQVENNVLALGLIDPSANFLLNSKHMSVGGFAELDDTPEAVEAIIQEGTDGVDPDFSDGVKAWLASTNKTIKKRVDRYKEGECGKITPQWEGDWSRYLRLCLQPTWNGHSPIHVGNSSGIPSGISKTHEITIATGVGELPTIRDLSANPLHYYVNPKISENSLQPVPWSIAQDDDPIDEAIEATLAFITQRTELDTGENRIPPFIEATNKGWLYHGAYHWNLEIASFPWNSHVPYRYWNNHNGVSAGIHWIQWLRTQSHKDMEFAEANSRHLMDLSTYNGPDRDADSANANKRMSGTQHHYAEVPWGNHLNGTGGFMDEADYLLNYCYLLDYERACELVKKRQTQWCRLNYVDDLKNETREYITRVQEVLLHAREPFIDYCSSSETLKERMYTIANHYLDDRPRMKYTALYVPSKAALLDVKLALGASYNNAYRNKLNTKLKKMLTHYGHYTDHDFGDSRLYGIDSIYPLLAAFELSQRAEYLEAAVAQALGHAGVVNKTSNDRWYGVSRANTQDLSSDIREWIYLQWILRNSSITPSLEVKTAPVHFFHVPQVNETNNGKHIAYTRCDAGGNIFLRAMTTGSGAGTQTLALFSDDETNSIKSVQFSLPQQIDLKKTGRYAQIESTCAADTVIRVEVELTGSWKSQALVVIHSSSGKLIHRLESLKVRAYPRDVGGSLWFQMLGDNMLVDAQIAVAREGGAGGDVGVQAVVDHPRELCATEITGTRPNGTTIQSNCMLESIDPGLVLAITTGMIMSDVGGSGSILLDAENPNRFTGASVLSRCVASTKEEFFFYDDACLWPE